MYARYIPPAKAQSKPAATEAPVPPPVSAPVVIPPLSSVARPKPTEYARYIPPPKPKTEETPKKHQFFEEEPLPPPKKRKVEDHEESAVTKKKTKKGKKDKQRTDTIDALESPEAIESDVQLINQDEESLKKPLKKEKAAKKEKKRKENSPKEDLEPQPDESRTLPDDQDGQLDGVEINQTENDVLPQPAREKRKKKKGAKKGDQEHSTARDDSDNDARHKAVLKKKEKSLRKLNGATTQPETSTSGMEEPMDIDQETPLEEVELHGLEPLPQPEPVALDTSKPEYETLPPWLAEPIKVSTHTTAPFTDLGISTEAAEALAAKGYKEAFAVQTAVIPLLLPSCDNRRGDLLVSAATGSGKTLAYVVPMVRDFSQGVVTRLRGVIVMPTRELVRQAQEVCEACASAFSGGGRKRVKIGTAMGSHTLQQEQAMLIERDQRYDPEGYQKRLTRLAAPWGEEYAESKILKQEDNIETLPNHVVDYNSKVDILICTPGRLVEHINLTPGFTLDYVRWLVADEADKLLAQSFQQWLDVVMKDLSTEKCGAREFPDSNYTGVRKVILSATMTRDLSLLSGLKLRRPKLIVLEGTSAEDKGAAHQRAEHTLPELLEEAAIKISDPNLKPLYLLDLLQSSHMGFSDLPEFDNKAMENLADDTSSSGSSSESESESESDSDVSSTSASSAEPESATTRPKILLAPASKAQTTVLVFTKSNETALRLSRLLALLSPGLEPFIDTLTSTTPTATRRKILRAFAKPTNPTRIIVASDLVARGIDLPSLNHVVNYDMPTSVASYVHRVGRTARAGRAGQAWTFFTNNEARWFWREIGGERKEGEGVGPVQRRGKVERIRLTDKASQASEVAEGMTKSGFSNERVKAYEQALEVLGKEAFEGRRRAKK